MITSMILGGIKIPKVSGAGDGAQGKRFFISLLHHGRKG